MLSFFGEKEPVDTVPKLWHRLSKRFIPPKSSRRTCTNVKVQYIIITCIIIDLHFGAVFSFIEKRSYPPIFNEGRMVNKPMIVARPPIQWVRLRQRRMDFGKFSTFEIIDEPVEVMPDTVSKKTSTNEGMVLLTEYGNIPANINSVHDIVTRITRSLFVVMLTGFLTETVYNKKPGISNDKADI